MTRKLEILSALAADDVRMEADGAISLMGILADGLFDLEKLPTRRRLAIILIANVVEVGEASLEVSLRYRGEIKWKVQMDLHMEELGTGVLLPVGMTTALLDVVGNVELLISIDGDEPQVAKTWPIFLDESASDPDEDE